MALRILRDADWLGAPRARAWCKVLAAVSIFIAAAYIATSHGSIDAWGRPLGTDFVSFYTVSELIRAGDASAVYDPAAHNLAEHSLLPHAQFDYYAFFYPPMFALLCLPLAYLAYPISLSLWLVTSFAPCVWSLRRILPARWTLMPILAFPSWLVNAGHGQNGFLSAALFALFMVSGRFPLLGGACLGVLSFKPQLALAVPVALIAGRRWASLAASIFSALALAGASWLVLGQKTWLAFLSSTPLARDVLEQGLVDPAKMVSLFSALRLIRLPVGLAYLAQALVGICALWILARVARRRPGYYAEGATLVAVTCLCTPFLLDYDLTILALPIAFVASEANRTGWRRWEKIVLLAAYVLPLVARPFAMLTGVGLAPLVIGSLLLVVVKRACDDCERSSSY